MRKTIILVLVIVICFVTVFAVDHPTAEDKAPASIFTVSSCPVSVVTPAATRIVSPDEGYFDFELTAKIAESKQMMHNTDPTDHFLQNKWRKKGPNDSLLDLITSIRHEGDAIFCYLNKCGACYPELRSNTQKSESTFNEALTNIVADYNLITGETIYYDLTTGEEVDIEAIK